MSVWTTLSSVARFGVEASRDLLRFGERVSPWPLSLIPRTARLPLDIAVGLADALTAEREPVPHDDHHDGDRDVPEGRPRSQATANAREATQATTPPLHARREQAGHEQQRPAPRPRPAAPPNGTASHDEPRTATIAGARSDGPDDAPRYDRDFRARNAPLYVREAGEGPALLLLHAFPLSSRMWEPQLVGLADQFRVIAPDFAGFGLSWVPATAFSLDDQADAVLHTLEDLKVDQLVVLGLSMGGYVAFPLVERLGERVRGLVLSNTRATADDENTIADRHRLAAEIENAGVEVAADELLPKLLGTSTMLDRPDLVDRVRAMVLENKESGVASALRAMAGRPDATEALKKVACPVLVIAGEEDQLIPPSAAHALASTVRDAQVEILRGGHLSNLEATLDFNRVVEEFAQRAFAERPRLRAHRGRA